MFSHLCAAFSISVETVVFVPTRGCPLLWSESIYGLKETHLAMHSPVDKIPTFSSFSVFLLMIKHKMFNIKMSLETLLLISPHDNSDSPLSAVQVSYCSMILMRNCPRLVSKGTCVLSPALPACHYLRISAGLHPL